MRTPAVTKPKPEIQLSNPVNNGRRAELHIVPSAPLYDDNGDATAAARGDRDAFERLYRAHMPKVFSVVVRMTGNRETAEELVQDIFVRAWNKLPSFRGESAVSTWLFRLAVNVVLSHRKTQNIRNSRFNDDPLATESAVQHSAPEGARLDLENAIAALPQGARHVFVLHDVEGHKHEEIANLLGISSGGSKAQLHRARMLLREALNR